MNRLLANPTYRRRAEELRDWAAHNDGAANAADAVEELAERPPTAAASPAKASPPPAADKSSPASTSPLDKSSQSAG